MSTTSPPRHYPGEVTSRPRGILKNASSDSTPRVPQLGKENQGSTPALSSIPTANAASGQEDVINEKEITLQNTLQNAGRRRSSADVRGPGSRRQSSTHAGNGSEENPRLKWDEANLYLAEQNKSATMKITEPKTPYARQYDPSQDEVETIEEDEDPSIDPRMILVDEKEKGEKLNKKHETRSRESDIPGLDLGEPEEAVTMDTTADHDRIIREGSVSSRNGSEKHVSVGEDDVEQPVGLPTREEMEKHKQFEMLRKKHYEMKDVKGLLGHSEELDDLEDEDDNGNGSSNTVPPMPSTLPSRFANGSN